MEPSVHGRSMGTSGTRIEFLEQRIVAASFVWIAAASGAWENAANWSFSGGPDADGTPDAANEVEINTGTDVTVTISSNVAVSELTVVGTDILSISSGTLEIFGVSSISNLTMSAGTLSAFADVTLTGDSVFWISAMWQGTNAITNEGTLFILGGDPNLYTTLKNAGTITQGVARLDLVGADAKVENLAGATYWITGTGDYSWLGKLRRIVPQ